MKNQPVIVSERKIGLSTIGLDEDEKAFKKTKDGWIAMETSLPHPESTSIELNVAERQAEGGPDHWSIVIGREQAFGDIFFVNGDIL